ncbi:MAG: ribonuclease J [Clostridia bacterium]|nr:ribonuclease J [Clostridia bacterium]
MAKKTKNTQPLRIISLGGLQEIGKNITVLEYGNDILVIDCGLAFPDDEMLGVDLVIPDVDYLEKNADRIRAVLLTHGHEDHIGALPYVLKKINPPIYGTRLTLGILKNKLEEFRYEKKPDLHTVEAGSILNFGVFRAEFIHVNHSIADACCIAIKTPLGTVLHTGDFKLDVSPIDGQMMDIARLGQLGNDGVLLMLGESTNAERPGFTPSERKVGSSLEQIFMANPDNRIIIATFSSNVHRVQQIVDASARHGRKVAVIGRSMQNVVGAAVELGYMKVPDGVLIDISEIRRFRDEELTLITTGSQGEPMSALYRIAFAEHDKVKLRPKDLVILSSSPIPGNEKLVGKIVNALVKNGIRVVNDSAADVHVSGHACQEELKLMLALIRPKYFMPIHGEYRHLYAHKALAEFMGIAPENVFVSEIGRVLEIDKKGARFNGSVPAGKILVDGSGVGDVGSVVLRDRKHLSQDGLIVVVATVDLQDMTVLSGPDIISRGFVYVRESEEMMEEARARAGRALEEALADGTTDWMQLKNAVREALSKYFFNKTKRKPMILPVIMNV